MLVLSVQETAANEERFSLSTTYWICRLRKNSNVANIAESLAQKRDQDSIINTMEIFCNNQDVLWKDLHWLLGSHRLILRGAGRHSARRTNTYSSIIWLMVATVRSLKFSPSSKHELQTSEKFFHFVEKTQRFTSIELTQTFPLTADSQLAGSLDKASVLELRSSSTLELNA